MWKFIRSSLLSIEGSKDPATAIVTSRIPQDITRLWCNAVISTTPVGHREYNYQATIDREAIAAALRSEVCQFVYSTWRRPHWYCWAFQEHERCPERA